MNHQALLRRVGDARLMPSLMLAALFVLMEKFFLAILGNATAAQEVADGRIGFSLFQGAGRAGRSQIHDRDEPADQSPPLNFMPSVSTLWEKHDFVVNNGAKLPKTTHCKHCKNLSYSVTNPNWERLKTVPGMSSRQMMKRGHCLCTKNVGTTTK